MVDSILATLAGDEGHGSAELWLVMYVASRGGRAEWRRAIEDYAELKGWRRESARIKLQRAYSKLKRLGILQKRREWLTRRKRIVVVALTPRARAVLLQACV